MPAVRARSRACARTHRAGSRHPARRAQPSAPPSSDDVSIWEDSEALARDARVMSCSAAASAQAMAVVPWPPWAWRSLAASHGPRRARRNRAPTDSLSGPPCFDKTERATPRTAGRRSWDRAGGSGRHPDVRQLQVSPCPGRAGRPDARQARQVGCHSSPRARRPSGTAVRHVPPLPRPSPCMADGRWFRKRLPVAAAATASRKADQRDAAPRRRSSAAAGRSRRTRFGRPRRPGASCRRPGRSQPGQGLRTIICSGTFAPSLTNCGRTAAKKTRLLGVGGAHLSRPSRTVCGRSPRRSLSPVVRSALMPAAVAVRPGRRGGQN